MQTQIEEAARHGNVSFLRSGMTGEEILQLWLKQHPDVLKSESQECQGKASTTRRSGDEDRTGSPSLSSAPLSQEEADITAIPPELAPYENTLPPSLLPVGLQYALYMGTPTTWGVG